MEFPLDKKLRRKIDDLIRSNVHAKLLKRLLAVRWLDEGKSIEEVADLLGVTTRTVRDWLSILRNKGFDALLVLHYKGDAGNLSPNQMSQLKAEIATGRFHCARQVKTYLLETFQASYSLSGVKRLLQRIGCSYHQISGFLFKADTEKQQTFIKEYEADRPKPGEKKDATSSTPAIRSGAWRPSFPAGSCVDNVSTSASAAAANGSTFWAPIVRRTRNTLIFAKRREPSRLPTSCNFWRRFRKNTPAPPSLSSIWTMPVINTPACSRNGSR